MTRGGSRKRGGRKYHRTPDDAELRVYHELFIVVRRKQGLPLLTVREWAEWMRDTPNDIPKTFWIAAFQLADKDENASVHNT